MLYDYQYDIATIIAGLFLLLVVFLRRVYKTKANTLLICMLICNLLAAILDVASIYCISYPTVFPMWFNNFTALGYLFAFNMMGVLYFAYIDSKTKILRMWTPTKIICVVIAVGELILIASSPVTHWVAYFDDNLIYQHGTFAVLLYIIAALLLFGVGVMFYCGRHRFNLYQILAICSFIAVVFVGVLIQALYPKLVVAQFGCELVLFFIYISLENPVYYTYKSTNCLNRTSFQETLKIKLRNNEKVSLVAISISDYAFVRRNLSLRNQERLSSRIAQFLQYNYGLNGYCIADDQFVITLKKNENYEWIFKQLDMFFAQPFQLIDTEISVAAKHVYIESLDGMQEADAVETGIHYILENVDNGVEVVEDFSEIVATIRRKYAVSHAVRYALENKTFEVYYQPIRDVKANQFHSVEALLRMIDPELGFVSPEEFIPIAEEDGVICKVGDLVFEKVCQFIRGQLLMNKGVHCVEINLSPIQCNQEDLVKNFSKIMEKYDISPSLINLEITETASTAGNTNMNSNINLLHGLGISFSIDDYGSGFASAEYLFRLPVDIVKIDKGILWQAMKDKNAMIVLEHTMMMVKKLGKKIVVEGIEDMEMVRVLEAMDCDYMQGYYYSKPLPEAQYLEFLEKNNTVSE